MDTKAPPEAFYGQTLDAAVVVLRGRVEYAAAAPLRAFFDGVDVATPGRTVVVDLTAVGAIDSTGMGLLARLGRRTLEHGRRAVLVCDDEDVTICLRSAAFDRLFMLVAEWPLDEWPELREVPIDARAVLPGDLGRLMLQAHRDLAELSEENQASFAGVIAALAAEVPGGSGPR